MLKTIFTIIGIYTVIKTVWQAYEISAYRTTIPRDKDTFIAIALTLLIYLLIR